MTDLLPGFALGILVAIIGNHLYNSLNKISGRKCEIEEMIAEKRRIDLSKLMKNFYKERYKFKCFTIGKYELPLIQFDKCQQTHPIELNKVKISRKDYPPELPWKMEGLADRLVREYKKTFKNKPTYRLIDFLCEEREKHERSIELVFALGEYKDYVETCEGLKWEVAENLVSRKSVFWDSVTNLGRKRNVNRFFVEKVFGKKHNFEKLSGKLKYRMEVGENLSDFKNRSIATGINTLTVLHFSNNKNTQDFGKSIMLIHKRSAEVLEGAETLHVVPAGTFQPLTSRKEFGDPIEFSLEWNIMREFGEELLNYEKFIGLKADTPITPFEDNQDLKNLKELFDNGFIKIYFLGIGLDPATTKPEILTLALVDGDELFDRIPRLRTMAFTNWEGEISERPSFSKDNLLRCATLSNMIPAGAGCLAKAYEFFDEINESIQNRMRAK